MERTRIEWCDHTFNPWVGCSPVSAGCERCYARRITERWGGCFSTRVRTSARNWAQPLLWNRRAERTGARERVFCGSMCDWLDFEAPVEWLAELLALVAATPGIDWLMLTKRPENWAARMLQVRERMKDRFSMQARWVSVNEAPENVWFGVTAEDEASLERRTGVMGLIPARVKWVSAEPLLERIDLGRARCGIDWVVAGGEKGSGARRCWLEWMDEARLYCKDNGIRFFFKQAGDNCVTGMGEFDVWETALSGVKEWPEARG